MITRTGGPGDDLLESTMSIGTAADELVGHVDSADEHALQAFFAAHHLPPCRLLWDPQEADLKEEVLQYLLEFWQQRRRADGLLPRNAIDPVALRRALGYIMLLDVIDGGSDFRYRLYGTIIAERTGFDWTGRRLSEMAAQVPTGTFYEAVYRSVMRRRQPIYTISGSPLHVAATWWSRLILPVADPDCEGEIGGFLVGNCPGEWRLPREVEEPARGQVVL